MAELEIEITGITKGLQDGIRDAEKTLNSFANKAISIGKTLSLAITAPLTAIGVASIKAASDTEESFSKFDTIFRDIRGKAEATFESLRNEYGLSGLAAKSLLGDTGDLLTGFGFSQTAALKLADEVNRLAVDLASFTNFSGGAEGASKALTSALLGEREAVKSLGISILEEDVKKQVAINTAKGLIFETERQAKAQATLDIALQQSGNAIGDYSRTSESFANQLRLAQSRLGDLSVELGQIFLPLATKVISGFGDIIQNISNFDSGTKTLIVSVGLLAAAIGPLLLSIGTFVKLLPIFSAGFAALTGPIGLAVIAVGALAAGLVILATNTGLSEAAQKKQETALKTYEGAISQAAEAQQILNEFNSSFVNKSPEFIKLTKEKIKLKIEEAKATLEQAKAENILAVEEAKKESALDIIIGFERVQRRVNKVQEEGIEKTREINKALDDLTISYIKLGTESVESTDEIVTSLGLIGAKTAEINKLNEQRDLAKDQTEINLITGKVKALQDQLDLINAIAERANTPEAPKVDLAPAREVPLSVGAPLLDEAVINAPGVITQLPIITEKLKEFSDYYKEIQNQTSETTELILSSFTQLASQIAFSLDISNNALKGFIGTLLTNTPKIIQAILKTAAANKKAAADGVISAKKGALANGIFMATETGKTLGPIGLALLPVLIGGVLALISGAFSKVGAGGGGGGSSSVSAGSGVGSGVGSNITGGATGGLFNKSESFRFEPLTIEGDRLRYVIVQSNNYSNG